MARKRGGERERLGERRTALQRDVKKRKCKQDKGRDKETMMGKEEKRQEEVVLIYTLKSPQILHGSTQLSIVGKEPSIQSFISSFCLLFGV